MNKYAKYYIAHSKGNNIYSIQIFGDSNICIFFKSNLYKKMFLYMYIYIYKYIYINVLSLKVFYNKKYFCIYIYIYTKIFFIINYF